MLTDLQKKKLTHLFHVMDTDDNGVVEWADYERIARNIADSQGLAAGSEAYDQLMAQYRYGWQLAEPHAEGSGMDLDTWLEVQDEILKTPGVYDTLVRPSAYVIFDAFDQDGDQQVSVEEWREFFRCYSIDPDQADECFARYDINGDGFVSRGELIDLVAQFYMSSDPAAPGNWLYGEYD